MIKPEEIAARASQEVFGGPLIMNVWRSTIVEAIVSEALKDTTWVWCSRDYAACDFKNATGLRLEVKQAAAKQTWQAPTQATTPRFDIAPRTGEWVGPAWNSHVEKKRNADIFLFCFHPIVDESADHRDAAQWEFYPVAECDLPESKSISLAKIKMLSPSYKFGLLVPAISGIEQKMANRQSK